MKKTLATHEITTALILDENANWTRRGAFALAKYLEQLEEDIGEEIELDVIALRCEYSEYKSLQDFAEQFWQTSSQRLTRDEAIKEYIEHRSILIEFDGGIIVEDF